MLMMICHRSHSQNPKSHVPAKLLHTRLETYPNPKISSYFASNSSQSCISPSTSHAVSFLLRESGYAASRCIYSILSSAASSVDWNDAVSDLDVNGRLEVVGFDKDDEVNEASKAYISVRAYFFSTSVDLRSLVEQNKHNFISPSSRMTNYVCGSAIR